MKLKDKKIQFYTPEKDTVWKKSYPYSEEMKNSGGMWAYVRQLQGTENYSLGMSIDKAVLTVEINYNELIQPQMKAEFNGKVWDVSNIDNFEFTNDILKLRLTQTVDNNEYEGEIYID